MSCAVIPSYTLTDWPVRIELESKDASSLEVGTLAPVGPPLDADQQFVSPHLLPTGTALEHATPPETKYRLVAAAAGWTSTITPRTTTETIRMLSARDDALR